MTADQITLVQESFQKVIPIAPKISSLLFDKLFELDPSLRPLFKGDLAEQGTKLMQMIRIAVNGLNNIEALVPAIQTLGMKHIDYGVKDEHYDTVGKALLWSLEQGLGEAFDQKTLNAWEITYQQLVKVMTENANKG